MAAKRVNIYLKDRVHTEAKIASVLKKTTLNTFLEQAIRDIVKQDERLVRELLK
jgi:predicted HicB family RNase H-like nuclease